MAVRAAITNLVQRHVNIGKFKAKVLLWGREAQASISPCSDGCRHVCSPSGGDGFPVPVDDPVPAAMMQAISLAKLEMSHCKPTYPNPPAKRISGYDFIDFSPRNQAGKNSA